MEVDDLSKFTQWIARGAVRGGMKELFLTAPTADGTLRVSLSTGGAIFLPLEGLGPIHRISEDTVYILGDSESMFELVGYCWPHPLDDTCRQLGNGTTFHEMIEMISDVEITLAVLEYGRLHRWWKLVYDENHHCQNCDGKAALGYACMVRLDEFRRPPRRAKRKRQRAPLASKFRDVLFPEKGVAIA